MKKTVTVLVLFLAACANAAVTFQTPAPSVNGGLFVDNGFDVGSDNSRQVQWRGLDRDEVGQNFVLDNAITMDKYAFQLRNIAGAVGLPEGDELLTVQLWELPAHSWEYPDAGNTKIYDWTLTIEGANENAAGADWLVIDTPDVSLQAGVNYGMKIGFTNFKLADVARKIWIYNGNPDGQASNMWAVVSAGDPTVAANYSKTWRSNNFAVIAVPEPTTIGLLSLGGLFLSRRKSRRQ